MSKKKATFCGLSAIFIAAAIYSVWLLVFGRGNSPAWNTDLNIARQRASAVGKPLLVEFSAEWCGPCQWMKKTTLHDPSVTQALEKYVLVSIDVDDHPELAGQFDVETVPQFFVIGSTNGNILKESRFGAMPPEEFLDWLNADSDLNVNEALPGFGNQSLATRPIGEVSR